MSHLGPEPAVRLEGVSFGYPGSEPVLRDVDLEIRGDDLLAIIGPNGSGKTTLLSLMLGLLEPDAGSVLLLGEPPRRSRHRVGYVPQGAAVALDIPVHALDVVLTGRLARSPWGSFYGRSHQRAAREALERVGLPHLAHRTLRSLSGGELQRVLVARALAAEAELLLLDEPTTGVDFHAESELMDLLVELNREIPVAVVSHDVGLVSARFRGVACLAPGHGISIHPATALDAERLQRLYSGPVSVVDHSSGMPRP